MKAGPKMFFFLATLALAAAGRIRSDDIHTLHFEAGAMTASHRGRSFPQLNNLAEPGRQVLRAATCYRTTHADAPWDCDFDGPAVQDYEVACVPWAADGDAYVVDGGCFLRYRYTTEPPAATQAATEACPPCNYSVWESLTRLWFNALLFAVMAYCLSDFRLFRTLFGPSGVFFYHRYCPAGCSRHCSECRYIITPRRTGFPGATETGLYTDAVSDRIFGWVLHLPAGAPFPYRARVRDVPGERWIPKKETDAAEESSKPDAGADAAPQGPSDPPACSDPSCAACPRAAP